MGDDAKPTAVERPLAREDPRRLSRASITEPRYESGKEIGRGGMGRVVEATDRRLGRVVAVKEALTSDAEHLRRFRRETQITARLEHPAIVPLYDAGDDSGAPYYVMRRVTGRPLSELVRDAPTLNDRLALIPHILAAAQAIAHAHQRGIIHRDIKPANILVGELGETVVIDWGLAKVVDEPDDADESAEPASPGSSLQTRVGAVFGTPGFMAPEQVRGDPVGRPGDVYALGATLYNVLAGRPPHEDVSVSATTVMERSAQKPPAPLSELVPGVPAELSTIVDTALVHDLDQRYRDAAAFAEDLQRFLAGQLVASHRYSARERFARYVRKHRAALAIAAAAVVLLLVVGTYALVSVLDERDRADIQAQLASAGQRDAELARATADERADQLLISRARTLLETNPTASLASLKELPPTSKRAHEARGIAHAAQLRGVAWAMKGPDEAAIGTLDPTATRFAQIGMAGKVYVWDLEGRRSLFVLEAGRSARLAWLREGAALLVYSDTSTRLLDATTGAALPHELPPLRSIAVSERGTAAIVIDHASRAYFVDVATTRQSRLLAENAISVAISPLGKRAAIVTTTEQIVVDAGGNTILRRASRSMTTHLTLTDSRIAMIDGSGLVEAPIEADATWRALTIASRPGSNAPLGLHYLRETLFVAYANGSVMVDIGEPLLREVVNIKRSSSIAMSQFGAHHLVVGTDGQRIFYADGRRSGVLYLPTTLRSIRVYARPARPRVVSTGDGVIVVHDLPYMPALSPIPPKADALFATEDIAITVRALTYGWFDIASQMATPLSSGIASPDPLIINRRSGRIALRRPGSDAFIFRAGGDKPEQQIRAPLDIVVPIGQSSYVYSVGNHVYGGTPGQPRLDLGTTDGDVEIVTGLDGDRYAVASNREVVRGDLATGTTIRFPLPSGGAKVTGITSRDNKLVVAQGDQILHEVGSRLIELGHFASPITSLMMTSDGVVATLADDSAFFVAMNGKTTRLASVRGLVLVGDHRLVVPGPVHFEIIETQSLARWPVEIPITRDMPGSQLDLSPSGARLLEKSSDGHHWLWQLPPYDEDLGRALAGTNLVEDDNGLLLWPWQAAAK